MNVFGIGLPELAVIAAIGLLVFGPKRLPELGKTLGRTLKGFQSASSEFEKEFRSAINTVDLPAASAPAASASVSAEAAAPGDASSAADSGQPPAAAAVATEQPADGPSA